MLELKHSIKLYLAFAGGPSEYLCSILLKIIDCYDDLAGGKDPQSELNELSFIIVDKLFSDVQLVVNRMKMQSNCPKEITDFVPRRDTFTDRIGGKYCVLRDMSRALKLMSSYNNVTYPKITDIEGNEI